MNSLEEQMKALFHNLIMQDMKHLNKYDVIMSIKHEVLRVIKGEASPEVMKSLVEQYNKYKENY